MHDFIEHRPSPILIKLMQLVWPLYSALKLGNLHIEASKDLIDAFSNLRDKPAIICPNHPFAADGAVLYGVSAIVGEQFAFLTAREMFRKADSFQSWWLQKIGCYSVERGTADMHAFKASCHILKQGEHKIVIFPEGEISYQNELLRDFENGPELIALSASHELEQSGSPDSIKILPLALKYRYRGDIRLYLSELMQQVETRLGLKNDSDSLKRRIKRAFELIFSALEEEQGIEKQEQTGLDARLSLLSANTIAEIEKFTHIQCSNGLDQLGRIHILINELSKMQYNKEHKGGSRFARSSMSELVNLYCNQLKRLVRLMAVSEHSFAHDLTQEEAAELLSLLVQEVGGKVTIKTPDFVQIDAAEVIDVKPFLPASPADRRKSVQALKVELERRISVRLAALERDYVPIMIPRGTVGAVPCVPLTAGNFP